MTRATGCLLLILSSTSAGAQDLVDGYASAMVDVLPDVNDASGRQAITELRTRLFAERRFDAGPHLRINLAGYVDALLADRDVLGAAGTSADVVVQPTDLYVEWRATHFDLRAGASRVVWGRLDEFQPSDIVNPTDVTRFLLEGRSEARLAVGLVRGRAFLPGGVTVEGVLVPKFRRGRFDQLDEATSPFNVGAKAPAICLATFPPRCTFGEVERREPDFGTRNMQGGARVTGTVGRVDVGASVYRGFEPFASYSLEPFPFPTATFAPVPPTLVETFPRFTMLAGDFETARGPWGIRGEAAYFPEDTLQSTLPVAPVPARNLEIGAGVDRRAGNYRIAANVIASRHRVDREDVTQSRITFDPAIETTSVLLVGWAERSFARETRAVRLLAAYNPDADSAFVRGLGAISLRDNVWIEMSAGWLTGSGRDMLSQFSTRDFIYARLKLHF